MNETAADVAPSPDGALPSGRAAAGGEPLARVVYVTMRLAEIVSSIAEMAKERERLTAELKAPSEAKAGVLKKLRERRGYLAMRVAILRAEQGQLQSERKSLGPATSKREGRTAPKRLKGRTTESGGN